MDKLDADKDRIVSRYVTLDARSEVLDVGCAVGTFLQRLRQRYGATRGRRRLQGSARAIRRSRGVEFHCGLFYEALLAAERFDLVTMWHFLEHDYDPLRSLRTARRVLKPGGTLVDRSAAARQPHVPPVRRPLARPAGAAAHRAARPRAPAAAGAQRPASRSSTTCPTARSPRTSISSPARRFAC